ncbi:MAG TPA: DMT family transporter [Bacteroidales bacterium]|nr:DMT family transporter [Bacteroidales bacterium]
MESPKAAVYLSLVLTMLFWGLTFVFYKFAFESFRPITVIFLRLIISVPFIVLSARLLKKMEKVERSDLLYVLMLSAFEPFLYFMGESYGLTFVSSTMAAVIVATIPLIVPVAAFIVYRERLNLLNKIGLMVSFSGVLAVVFSGEVQFGATLKGALLMFMAVFSAVGYAILVKRLTGKYNGFTITAYQNFFGIFMFLPFFLLVDFDTFRTTIPTLKAVIALVYLAVFGSSITFILFTRGVRELGASRANIFTNLIPVFAAVASFFLLNEAMPSLKIVGIVLVLIGLIMSQVKSVKLRKSQTPPTIQFPG